MDNISLQEWELRATVDGAIYGDLFDDMLFSPFSIVGEYTEVEINGRKTHLDPPDKLTGIADSFTYRVEPLDGCNGRVDLENKVMTIDPACLKDYSVVLHEVIHIVASAYDNLPRFFRDAVLLALYNKLSTDIQNLDKLIIKHTHILSGYDITEAGGEHDILFLLKSLDLDIRLGYKLGTVCGYGRSDLFDQ